MSVKFDFFKTPAPNSEDSRDRYHARAITYSTVSTERIINDIQEKTSFSESDVKTILSTLGESLGDFLEDGERVHLKGIGYFQITLTSPKDCDPRKTRPQSVGFKSVKFRADKDLRNRLSNLRTERSQFKNHSARLSSSEVDTMVKRHFNENEILTRKDMQRLCGMTQITALRHINRMIDEGKIKNINTRYQPVYVIVRDVL